MGNNRFRLSNMMPNAWFYRLKDMSRASRSHCTPNSKKRSPPQRIPPPQHAELPNRTSYYFPSREKTEKLNSSSIHPKASDTHFPTDPPRKSNRRSMRPPVKPTTKLLSSSDSFGCNYRAALTSVCKSNGDLCNYRVTSSAADVVDLDSRSSFSQKFKIHRSFDGVPEFDLPPIITKPVKKAVSKAQLDGLTESSEQGRYKNGSFLNEHKSPTKRIPPGIHRIKIKESSPRPSWKRNEARIRSKTATRSKAAIKQRGCLTESFAIMKSSSDPQREFKESMVEMIVENNIRASKDLEELLACYLWLNSGEYHEVILNVFKEIWFDLANISF